MATVIRREKNFTIICVPKGKFFYANHIIPEGTEDFANIDQTENGSTRICLKVDAILVVERLHNSLQGCMHIRFIREDRKADRLNFPEKVKGWPRMRAALHECEIPCIHVPGGFKEFVAIYRDEIAIPNYVESGSYGWIVRRKKINQILAKLPAILPEIGELDKSKPITTFYVAWNGETCRSFFRIFATSEEAEAMTWVDNLYKNPPTQQPMVQKWEVGISTAGNPIIIKPVSEEGALVPFSEIGCKYSDRLMPTGISIERNWRLRNWNRARAALLGYHQTYSS